jgi:toxin-antitoxin system PIN domain toxin
MKVALLDVDVLLALAWPNHQHHAAAHRWFQDDGRRGWATCALTELAFVRLSANPAYTPVAVPPEAAAALLERLTAHQAHRYWRMLPGAAATIFRRALGHRQVLDAYLVHLAERHEGRLATFDRRLSVHASRPTSVCVIEA